MEKSLVNKDEWFVYMVKCSDGTLYTGYTNDVEKRVATHNKGRGAKYTRSRLPVTLVYQKLYPTRSIAMKAEYMLKQFSRGSKLMLVKHYGYGKNTK